MATIQDYTSGKVCEHIKMAFSIFDSNTGDLSNTDIGRKLLRGVQTFEPHRLRVAEAIQLVENSQHCAIGKRVCQEVFNDAPLTETVFLDELAQGMVMAGKAHMVTKAQAIENIRKYRKRPIIVSKVSGKHAEICFTWAKLCVYWNSEKHRLKCINRQPWTTRKR